MKNSQIIKNRTSFLLRNKTSLLLRNKRILVTGGTGSFGSLFVKEILKYNLKEVIIFSRDEDKQGQMKRELSNSKLRFILGDIRDYKSVREVMRGVDIVIHAAALKWIPAIEQNVWEGVKTNIIGAQNIVEAARDANVEKVVALSTDKAVEPVNAYGMTKALQERLMTTANLYENGTKTIFVSTRYGNVLGSRGSVVPLFRYLIDIRKPLTITDPNMTRFLISLDESVELVLMALEKGVGGEVFVRKIPSHTIGELAEVMLESIPKKNRKKIITGVRPGEKIHEVLISMVEAMRTIEIDNYYIILPQILTSSVEKRYKGARRLQAFRYASDTANRLTKAQLAKILQDTGWI